MKFKVDADLILNTLEVWHEMMTEDLEHYKQANMQKSGEEVCKRLGEFLSYLNETYKGKEYYTPSWSVSDSIEEPIFRTYEKFEEGF